LEPRLTWIDAPADVDESCYIDTVLGVVSVLRAIAGERTRASALIENGKEVFATTLLGVEQHPSALFFDKGSDRVLNARVLRADRIIFVTSDQGVPVQFNCSGPVLDSYEETEAFRVALPGRVLRLQRRGYFRLTRHPSHLLIMCEIVVDDGDMLCRVLTPEVLDLSCGGIAAVIADEELPLAPGHRSKCRLALAGVGRIDSLVEVRDACDIVLPNGRKARRYGLEFVNLAARSVTAIQRYILEQQRARKKLTV
jgi:c-di-GMP-binding flagellar brake protein YcgR